MPAPKKTKARPATKPVPPMVPRPARAPKPSPKPSPKLSPKPSPSIPRSTSTRPRVIPQPRTLVIVESAAKQRSLQQHLGSRHIVKVCEGALVDLPRTRLGIDVEHDFSPEYVLVQGRKKLLIELKKSAEAVDVVYLAFDPDPAGEALAWHLAEALGTSAARIERLRMHELGAVAVAAALTAAGSLDPARFLAHQARAIIERLVEHQLSPILWSRVQRGLVAGRLQTLAVRLIVERERALDAAPPIIPLEVEVGLRAPSDAAPSADGRLRLQLERVDGSPADGPMGERAELAAELAGCALVVSEVRHETIELPPAAPFSTATLIVEAARQLRYTAPRTLELAQRLYEGVELGDGPVALITYPLSASTRIPAAALAELREHISHRHGAAYLARVSGDALESTGTSAQAVRPTSMAVEPALLRQRLEGVASGNQEALRETQDLLRLYTLVWSRYVASQMSPALVARVRLVALGARFQLGVTRHALAFAGHRLVSSERDPLELDEAPPRLCVGDHLRVRAILPLRHAAPLARYSEASLTEALVARGLGRPATYATLLATIFERGYAEKRDARLCPTLLGTKVSDLLGEFFPGLVDEGAAARLELALDALEHGQGDWRAVVRAFYTPLASELAHAKLHMRDLRRDQIATSFRCEQCDAPLVVKWGRNGEFLACTGFPACKNGKEFTRDDSGAIQLKQEPVSDESCPSCGRLMLVKRGRYGAFLSCTGYPACKSTRPISLGVACPKPGCDGYLAEKRSRRGKIFFGCANYSKTACDFVSWDRPVPEACPRCTAPFLVKKEGRAGTQLRCIAPGCGHAEAVAPVGAH